MLAEGKVLLTKQVILRLSPIRYRDLNPTTVGLLVGFTTINVIDFVTFMFLSYISYIYIYIYIVGLT